MVLRDGQWTSIDAKNIVVGDIIETKQGDRIPADLRMVELKTITFKTDQVEVSTIIDVSLGHFDRRNQPNQ